MAKKKHAIITGGAKGIGASSSRIFAREGYHVTIMDIDDKEGEKLAEELGEEVQFIRCDMGNEAMIIQSFAHSIKTFGEIDVLVNNAGIQRYGTVLSTTSEEWDEVMTVNLKSCFLCSKEAIKSMKKKGNGVVVNVSSVQAYISQDNVVAYTTAKTALLGFTRSIAVDYSPAIRSVAICPGTIDTPMLRSSIALSPNPEEILQECNDMHLMKRIGQPDEVGELIYFVASEKGSFITGQAIRVDGGLGIAAGGSKKAEEE